MSLVISSYESKVHAPFLNETVYCCVNHPVHKKWKISTKSSKNYEYQLFSFSFLPYDFDSMLIIDISCLFSCLNRILSNSRIWSYEFKYDNNWRFVIFLWPFLEHINCMKINKLQRCYKWVIQTFLVWFVITLGKEYFVMTSDFPMPWIFQPEFWLKKLK